MNNPGSYFYLRKIARLISQRLQGTINDQELEELNEWLKDRPENYQLFLKLIDKKRYQDWGRNYEKSDAGSNWEELYQRIRKEKKKTLYTGFYKYAASVLFIIFVGIGIYYASNTFRPEAEVITYNEPGSSKAILIFDDGESVILDSIGENSYQESDGTKIMKVGDLLSYSKTDSKKEKLQYNTLQIPQGGEYSLVLSDGSRVYLNSMSTLRYPVQFDNQIREVELTGEAYFEVNRNEDAPFIVKTQKSRIEVLGTRFNVNAYENSGKIITTLVSGKVKVQTESEQPEAMILEPSEQSVFTLESNSLEVRKVNTEFYTSWVTGEFLFYNDRLEDIMVILTRWYKADVSYSQDALKELRFSGNLNRYDDIGQILDIIKATGKVDVEVNNNTILFK